MSKRSNSLRSCAAVLLALAGGCIEGFETPSAYEEQRFLCGAEYVEVWDDLVAQCAATRVSAQPCGGVVSFAGALEGEPVTVESPALSTSFRAQEQNSGAVALDRVAVAGSSPYFVFSLTLGSLGGSVVGAEARTLELDSAAELASDHLRDDLASVTLRLEVASESVALRGLPESGAVVLELQTLSELAGTFSGAFGSADDELEGCFHLFAQETVLEGS